MLLFRLILQNLFRHPLRNLLTALGIAIALLSFTIIQTMLSAWQTGVRSASQTRLITRNATSLVVPQPIFYREQILQIKGVERVGYANWFGGLYQNDRAPFPQFAVDSNYLKLYPEYLVDPTNLQRFQATMNGSIVGEDLSKKYNLKLGDTFTLKGSIYPGVWEFKVSAFFKNKKQQSPSNLIFFHWDYLNERMKTAKARPPNTVGIFVTSPLKGENPALIAEKIDQLFKNSPSETLTESESDFQQSFLSMASSIIEVLRLISWLIIVIIFLVLANTMTMVAKERMREFAVLKAIGFNRAKLALVIFGESLFLALIGIFLYGLILIPIFTLMKNLIQKNLSQIFPIFQLDDSLLLTALCAGLALGLLSSLFPYYTIIRSSVLDCLRET